MDARYATALYSAATKQNVLDQVEKDVVKFQAAINANQRLKDYLMNPTIKTSIKAGALKDAAGKASLSAPFSNLLELLADNGRLKNFNNIVNSFKILMAAHRGEVSKAHYLNYRKNAHIRNIQKFHPAIHKQCH